MLQRLSLPTSRWAVSRRGEAPRPAGIAAAQRGRAGGSAVLHVLRMLSSVASGVIYCRTMALPPGGVSATQRSPIHGCVMSTATAMSAIVPFVTEGVQHRTGRVVVRDRRSGLVGDGGHLARDGEIKVPGPRHAGVAFGLILHAECPIAAGRAV